MYAVELTGFQKALGSFHLGPLDLRGPKGGVVRLLDKNGAGKTTILDIPIGLIFLLYVASLGVHFIFFIGVAAMQASNRTIFNADRIGVVRLLPIEKQEIGRLLWMRQLRWFGGNCLQIR